MSDRGFSLRAARGGDEAGIRRVVERVLGEFGIPTDPDGLDADLRDVQASYVTPGGCFFVLVADDGTIVGIGGIFRMDAETAELRKMYIEPEARGQGWGRRLLVLLIEHARSAGFHRLVLESASRLTTAAALYRSVGFTEYRRDQLHDRADVAMELHLTR
jgi:GNAT superfamily N-acetyltransferase